MKRGSRSDTKCMATIAAAGWKIIRLRGVEDSTLTVARKATREVEDDSVTFMYESTYTLEALAKQVQRREREEARS